MRIYLDEEYEVGFRNLAKISLFDKNGVDISPYVYEIIFEINYSGFPRLAALLMKMADNFQEGMEYVIEKDGSEILLTPDSLPVKLKCSNLGSVYDYEPEFPGEVIEWQK